MKAKQFKYIIWAKDLIVFFSILIVAFFPIGSMGGVETESIFSILLSGLKNTSATEFAYYAIFLSLSILLWALCHLIISHNQHHKIIGTIISVIMFGISGAVMVVEIIGISEIYGLTSTHLFAVVIAFTAIDIVFLIIEYFIFRNISQNDDEIETTNITTSEEISDNEEIIGKKHNKSWRRVFATIVMACGMIVFLCIDIHCQADEFIGTEYSTVSEFEIGDKFSGFVDIDHNFLDDIEEGKTHLFGYKSTAYIYRKKKTDALIEEKQQQIRKLMPESASEEDIKIYATEIKRLQTEIQDITLNFNSFIHTDIKVQVVGKITYPNPFTTVKYATITDITYDTQYRVNAASGIKWNNMNNKRLFGKQSIKLSKTEFAAGSDFSSTEIVAAVHYYDGSYKKSYITPTNYAELNSAAKGEHTLKWSDGWGSYECNIKIV